MEQLDGIERFNRNIVECKLDYRISVAILELRFNRNIVECKYLFQHESQHRSDQF